MLDTSFNLLNINDDEVSKSVDSKQKKCSICKELGHNKRSCKMKNTLLKINIKKDDNKNDMEPKVITKGFGAGGKNTNINGLSYENKTNIKNYCKNFETKTIDNKHYEIFDFDGKKIIHVEKKCLEIYLKQDFVKLEKSLQPDEAFIDEENKKLFIIEKKFQQSPGSVDEKIQTGLYKKEFYQELYPSYSIKYAYVLSDWFKSPKYFPEMRFLQKYGIRCFFGSDDLYFENIVKWIHS